MKCTFFINKCFSSTCSYWHVERSSDNSVKKFSTKIREFFGRRPKMIIKTVFRGKILHKISIWTRENSVESPAEGFLPEVGKVYPQCPKGLKKHFYQNQIFLQKCSYVNVVCPIDNPAEQARKKPKTFRWLTRNDNKILFYFHIFLQHKTFYWHLVRSVPNSARETLPEGWKKFDQVPKLIKFFFF